MLFLRFKFDDRFARAHRCDRKADEAMGAGAKEPFSMFCIFSGRLRAAFSSIACDLPMVDLTGERVKSIAGIAKAKPGPG